MSPRGRSEEVHERENVQTENLTEAERRGIKKLLKRVVNGEIVIYQTYKSGKLCVATLEEYREQGKVHCEKDRVVEWPEVEESMKDLECHMKGLNRVFNAGRTHGEEGMERTWKAKELRLSCIPNQRLSQRTTSS